MSVSDLTALLARVETAEGREQGPLLHEARNLLVVYTPTDGPFISRFVGLIQAGGYESAALALCARVLPGAEWIINKGCGMVSVALPLHGGEYGEYSVRHDCNAPLALLAAMLKALIAKDAP